MRWRYLYPQVAFPYDELVDENARRSQLDPEYELADTGVLDNGFWDITVDYAKETPEDLVLELRARNAGPHGADRSHVLPTLWFRNTWVWGITDTDPVAARGGRRIVADHTVVGRMFLTGDGEYTPLVCDNESNAERLWGAPSRSRFPEGRHQRPRRLAARDGQSSADRDQGGAPLPSSRSRRRRPRDPAPVRPPRDRRR